MARSIVDRMLGSIGLQRASADGSMRATRSGRLSNTFETERRHINSAVASGGAMLRARSRFHSREGSLLSAGKDTWVAYSVGTGLAPSWPDVKPTVRRALHKWWNRYAKRCDFDGVTTYYGLQAIVDAEVVEAGECFVRLVRSVDRPLRLQLIQSEQLPYDQSATNLAKGHEVRLGIEFDAAGERCAYHFYTVHPGDGTKAMTALTMERVPASEILHIFKVEYPGQLRGLPQTRAALVPANKLDDYDNAMLDRANVGSNFAVFIEREGTDRGSTDAAQDGPQPEMNIGSGSIIEGAPGEKATTILPPDPGNNYDAFTFRQATRVTSAIGVPYAETTGDLRKANYSSTRAGRQPFRRRIEQRQQFTLIPQFCDPVVMAALSDALLRGDLVLPRGASRNVAAYDNIDHVPPFWEYVDPRGDVQADIALADNLMKSRSKIVAERGEDPIELDDQIASDQKREDKLKLRRGGTAQPQTAAASDPTDDPEDQPDPEEEEDAA
jgi:lambda family phage portal protein